MLDGLERRVRINEIAIDNSVPMIMGVLRFLILSDIHPAKGDPIVVPKKIIMVISLATRSSI